VSDRAAEAEDPAGLAVCPSCGKRFFCDPVGACWCKALPPAHPVPDKDAACLCPQCLEERTS